MTSLPTSVMAVTATTMHTSGIYADMAVDGPEIGTLVAVVDRAKNLPNLKTMGKQNPYCAARLGKEAKKTNTDMRGGQTPKWDQELRFIVHDGPDYRNLKLSVFNDDKKTDLIGETWVNIDAILQPGGGQEDNWHTLTSKGRYAGEVRIELTYYDGKPRVEKVSEGTRSRKQSLAGQTRSRNGSMAGPRQLPQVKRRPLPTDTFDEMAVSMPDPGLHPVDQQDNGAYNASPLSHHRSQENSFSDLEVYEELDGPMSFSDDPYALQAVHAADDDYGSHHHQSTMSAQPSWNRNAQSPQRRPLPHANSAPAMNGTHVSPSPTFSGPPYTSAYSGPISPIETQNQMTYPPHDRTVRRLQTQPLPPLPPMHRVSNPLEHDDAARTSPPNARFQTPRSHPIQAQPHQQMTMNNAYFNEAASSQQMWPSSPGHSPAYYDAIGGIHNNTNGYASPQYYDSPPVRSPWDGRAHSANISPYSSPSIGSGPSSSSPLPHSYNGLPSPYQRAPNINGYTPQNRPSPHSQQSYPQPLPSQPSPLHNHHPSRKPILPRHTQEPGTTTPYSPDSLRALNPHSARHPTTPSRREPSPMYRNSPTSATPAASSPALHTSAPPKPSPTTTSSPNQPIIRSDGKLIDPSDHLPQNSWAPEPERKGAQQSPRTALPPAGKRFGPRDARQPRASPQPLATSLPSTPSSASPRPNQAHYRSPGGSPLSPTNVHALNAGHRSATGPPVPGKVPLGNGPGHSPGQGYRPGQGQGQGQGYGQRGGYDGYGGGGPARGAGMHGVGQGVQGMRLTQAPTGSMPRGGYGPGGGRVAQGRY